MWRLEGEGGGGDGKQGRTVQLQGKVVGER